MDDNANEKETITYNDHGYVCPFDNISYKNGEAKIICIHYTMF
jgi:hypothetical protein